MKSEKSARDRALSLLERMDRTEQELRRKLLEREYSAEDVEEALVFLKEYHYIDDAGYVQRYIRSHASGKSARQIRHALAQKGVARELIDEGLSEIPVDEERQIRTLLQKKGYRADGQMPRDEFRRVTASLCRRGFSYDAVRRVMEQMGEEEIW